MVDNNECTRDECLNALCVPIPLSGTECLSDGDPCTEDECREGVCRHLPVVEGGPCEADGSDGNECTLDTCQDGECVYAPNDGGGCLPRGHADS